MNQPSLSNNFPSTDLAAHHVREVFTVIFF